RSKRDWSSDVCSSDLRPIEIEIANASITPASVDPCLATLMKISPGSPESGYRPTCRYPLTSAIRNRYVIDWCLFGMRLFPAFIRSEERRVGKVGRSQR